MEKQIKIASMVVGLTILIGMMPSLIVGQETGSISGKVIPAEPGVKVRLIQNLSLMAETVTDENGNYIFNDVESGMYGLLFDSEINGTTGVFIYNDEVNNNWVVGEGKGVIFNIKETVQPNTPNVNINLYGEWPDYISRRVTVQFKEDTSDTQIQEIIDSCGCSVREKYEASYGTYYYLSTPENKTVLEIVRDLNLDENVELAEHEGIARVGEKNITEVEQDVLDALDNNEWIPVIIKIYEKNEAIIDSILSNLPASDFQLEEKLLRGDGFAGNITQKGFNRLVSNTNVKAIYLNRVAQIHGEDNGVGVSDIVKNEASTNWIFLVAGGLIILLIIFLVVIKNNKS